MKLLRYKVKNFRSVIDSGWIEVDEVTALIGVNESGKTNLLLPLWKLNPAAEGAISPTSDFPKANYAEIRSRPGDYEFITAEFDASDISARLSANTGHSELVLHRLIIGRAFDGTFRVSYPNFDPTPRTSSAPLNEALAEASAEIHSSNALGKEGTLKQDVLNILGDAFSDSEVTLSDIDARVAKVKELLPDAPAATSTIVPRLTRLLVDIEAIAEPLRVRNPSEDEDLFRMVLEELPKFVFYSNYGNLDSEIYLPHVVQNMQRGDLGAKEAAKSRTLSVLFSFVRLKPDEILELGKDFQTSQGVQPTVEQIASVAEKKRERTILLNSAGTDLTKKFTEWWKQGNYTFEFQADGDHFRIWVSDRTRPEKIELEDRSSGLQWFLSFYLVFLVESGRNHKNAILLLDEPGLSLHPLAQRDLSAFFEGLSQTNQLIYTTHSPFLVDADMLDRVRKVYVAPDGSTKASSDLRRGDADPRKTGATYAIYSALNISVSEGLLLGCSPVVVEGPSDQHLLSAIKLLLIAAGEINPSREIVFPPAHGAPNAKVLASILGGRDGELPFVLLDADEAGSRMTRDLKNGPYQACQQKVRQVDEWTQIPNSEVEDLFPANFIAECVDRIEKRPEQQFSDVLKTGLPMIPQIKNWASASGVQLDEGWKVALAREVKTRALAKGSEFFKTSLPVWKSMFTVLLS